MADASAGTVARKEILVEDERGRPCPALIKYGPWLFIGGSDGHRDLATEQIVPELAGKATEQCRNAYGRVQRRLERAGYSGDCAVWIENFTSGQHWRLERMALWPDYFGEEGHGLAVSFGAQAKMSGINMLTACVMGAVPEVQRQVGIKQPARGRASRITRVGDLVFVIGVRGHDNPVTKLPAPQEVAGAFDIQLDNCLDWLTSHLAKLGLSPDAILRFDGCIRDPDLLDHYHDRLAAHFGGRITGASYAIGTPLGARCEQEVGALAAAPGVAREVRFMPDRPDRAEATRTGGLVFTAGCSGLLTRAGGQVKAELRGDLEAQLRQALDNVAAALGRFELGLEHLLRLDVFLRNIYAEDRVIRLLADRLGREMPVLNVIGAEPGQGAEIELVAIAGE